MAGAKAVNSEETESIRIFTCDKCGATLRLAGGRDFENATAEHLCDQGSVDLEAGEATGRWVLRGVANADRYAIKGSVVCRAIKLAEGPAR